MNLITVVHKDDPESTRSTYDTPGCLARHAAEGFHPVSEDEAAVAETAAAIAGAAPEPVEPVETDSNRHQRSDDRRTHRARRAARRRPRWSDPQGRNPRKAGPRLGRRYTRRSRSVIHPPTHHTYGRPANGQICSTRDRHNRCPHISTQRHRRDRHRRDKRRRLAPRARGQGSRNGSSRLATVKVHDPRPRLAIADHVLESRAKQSIRPGRSTFTMSTQPTRSMCSSTSLAPSFGWCVAWAATLSARW